MCWFVVIENGVELDVAGGNGGWCQLGRTFEELHTEFGRSCTLRETNFVLGECTMVCHTALVYSSCILRCCFIILLLFCVLFVILSLCAV